MPLYNLSKKAYLKIMLHAAKHPTLPICGYLIGRNNNSGGGKDSNTSKEDPPAPTKWPPSPPVECKLWNDWSKCGRACLRCRCCADAPDYDPPRTHLKVNGKYF